MMAMGTYPDNHLSLSLKFYLHRVPIFIHVLPVVALYCNYRVE